MIHYLISVAGRLLDLHQPAELFLFQRLRSHPKMCWYPRF